MLRTMSKADQRIVHAQVTAGFRPALIVGDTGQFTITDSILPLILTPTMGPTAMQMLTMLQHLGNYGIHEELTWDQLGPMVGLTAHGDTYGLNHPACNAFYRMLQYLPAIELNNGWLLIPEQFDLDVQRFKRKWTHVNDAAWEVWERK